MTLKVNGHADLEETEVTVEYLKQRSVFEKEKPYLISFQVPLEDEDDRTNLEFEERVIPVQDLRPVQHQVSLEENGFEWYKISPEVMRTFFDGGGRDLELEGVQNILRKRFKTDEIIIFDHTHRKEDISDIGHEYKSNGDLKHSVILCNPHADQTPASARQRFAVHLNPQELEECNKSSWRIRIINFWKPIRHNVTSAPLLLCHPKSIKDSERVACDVVSTEYMGESFFLHYSSNHRWFWFSDQSTDVATIFVSYDSHPENGIESCFHTSCRMNCHDGRNENPRESMEARAIIINKISADSIPCEAHSASPGI